MKLGRASVQRRHPDYDTETRSTSTSSVPWRPLHHVGVKPILQTFLRVPRPSWHLLTVTFTLERKSGPGSRSCSPVRSALWPRQLPSESETQLPRPSRVNAPAAPFVLSSFRPAFRSYSNAAPTIFQFGLLRPVPFELFDTPVPPTSPEEPATPARHPTSPTDRRSSPDPTSSRC